MRFFWTLSISEEGQAAKAKESVRRSKRARGITMRSSRSVECEETGVGQQRRRTKARVSEKVGAGLAYQVAWRSGRGGEGGRRFVLHSRGVASAVPEGQDVVDVPARGVVVLRWLVRGELKQVTLDAHERQTPSSPVLRWFGVSLLAGGAALGGLVALSWQAILQATRHSVAAAAGGVAAAVLIGLLGIALVYASREQPLVAT